MCLYVYRVNDVTLLLVASDVGRLYVFALQPLDAMRTCQLLSDFQLCSDADASVSHYTVADS